jgi:hypothetical protein
LRLGRDPDFGDIGHEEIDQAISLQCRPTKQPLVEMERPMA